MTECGCGHGATPVARQQARVLIIVLLINAVMFVVGFAIALLFLRTSFGVIGRSVAGLRQAAGPNRAHTGG